MASIPVTFQGVLTFADVGIGGGPMPGGPSVSHPIAPGGPPPGYWGGVAPPLPTHPIAPGGPGGSPPGYWGGVAPPYVDIGLPGSQPHPSHPIVIPPDAIAPGVPSHPIYWPIAPTHPIAPGGPDEGGGAPPTPTHPIVIPGDDESNPRFEVKAAWSPQTGWVTVIVPSEGATVPTPAT